MAAEHVPQVDVFAARVADATAHRDRDELDRSVAALLLDVLDARAVSLHRLVESRETVRVMPRARVARGEPETHLEIPEDLSLLPPLADNAMWQQCVHDEKPVLVEDRSVFPLFDGRALVGLLEVLGMHMTSRDITLVSGILRILKNQLALLDYGELDTLTNLLNRKTFETRFEHLCRRVASRGQTGEGRASWLGLLDIDHFKSINDRHGHLFGDEVLLLLSQIMRRSFRAGDQLFRFGGEEFVIVLEGADAAGAATAFERLRRNVEEYAFPQVGRVTVSIGYTRVGGVDTPISCIERADAALYYAKRNGRNCAHPYETLLASGALTAGVATGEVELF